MTTLDPARGASISGTATPDVKSQPIQKLSLFALTAMVVGSMVGSGIFSLAAHIRHRDRALRRDHRLVHRRRRHVLPCARVSGAGGAQARSGCRCLRLRQGGFRRLSGLPVGTRILGRKLHRQRLVLGADQVDAWRVLSGVRRRQHGHRDRRRLDRHMAVPFHDPAWRSAGGRHQHHRHRREDRSDPGLHRDPLLCVQGRHVPREFLGWRGMPAASLFDQVRATMLVTVFVFLGIEGASVYSRYAKQRSRCRYGDHHWLPRRDDIDGPGHAASLRSAAPRRNRRHAATFDGGRARGRRRALGRRVHQHRPARVGAGRLSRLVADLRRSAVRRGQDQGHAGAALRRKTRTRCRPRRCG